VRLNSMPKEFRRGSVLIQSGEELQELPNDFVWIFAGGSPPSEFLKAAGIAFCATNPPEVVNRTCGSPR